LTTRKYTDHGWLFQSPTGANLAAEARSTSISLTLKPSAVALENRARG